MGMTAVIWLVALVAQAPVAGSPPAKATTLQELVASPAYQANIARLFAALPPDVFQRCATLVSTGSQTTVLQPASFNSAGFPVSGMWKQSFPVSGCGNDTTINFFFAGRPEGKVVSMAAAPGSTHAGITLQRDAYRYVTVAASPSAKDCTALHIRDTSYEGPAMTQREPVGGTPVGQPWRETWSVSACGQVIRVPVTFIPDATGTTIVTDLHRATRR